MFGEVLFDCFPGGESVIGGAPFNVAWNLRRLGLDPLLVSAVGDDELGDKALGVLESGGLDRAGVAVRAGSPTGRVTVENPEGEASYTFQGDCAWDHVPLPSPPPETRDHSLLYHGSLALRRAGSGSRRTLRELRRLDLPRFVDLNLRPPHFDPQTLPGLLTGAAWLKLNRHELTYVADRLTTAPGALRTRVETHARALAESLSIGHLLVTDGEHGAWWVAAGGEALSVPAHPVETLVDTVGAGDAFTAVTLVGVLAGWPRRRILERAVRFAARVCGLRGAITRDDDFYDTERESWHA